MRWVRFAVLILVAALLQAGVLEHISIKPDLLLILLVFFAIYYSNLEAIITSFTIGFAADIIGSAGSAMGPQIISFGLLGTLLSYLNRVIAIRKMSYQAIVIFITAFLCGVLANLLMLLRGQSPAAVISSDLFFTSLYSGLAGPFLFLPSARWMRIKVHRFGRR